MKRPIAVDGDIAYVTLTKGYVAIIDSEDVAVVDLGNWTAMETDGLVYAYRRESGKTILIHRIILNPPKNMHVDHRDGNPLNNRKTNLRLCLPRQNSRNSKTPSNNTSGYKGVSWCKVRQKWSSRIRTDGTRKSLGYFDSPESAYAAYCRAAEKFHKEFARLR